MSRTNLCLIHESFTFCKWMFCVMCVPESPFVKEVGASWCTRPLVRTTLTQPHNHAYTQDMGVSACTTPTHRIWVSLRARGERMGVISESLSHTLHLHIHIHICTPTYGLVIHVGRGGIVIWYCLWMHRVTHTSELVNYWADASRKCRYPTQKIFVTHLWHSQSQKKKVIIVYFAVSGLTQRSGKLRIVSETSEDIVRKGNDSDWLCVSNIWMPEREIACVYIMRVVFTLGFFRIYIYIYTYVCVCI